MFFYFACLHSAGAFFGGENAFVDGHEVIVKIYGEQVAAARIFKYLGVSLDPHGKTVMMCLREKIGTPGQ